MSLSTWGGVETSFLHRTARPAKFCRLTSTSLSNHDAGAACAASSSLESKAVWRQSSSQLSFHRYPVPWCQRQPPENSSCRRLVARKVLRYGMKSKAPLARIGWQNTTKQYDDQRVRHKNYLLFYSMDETMFFYQSFASS